MPENLTLLSFAAASASSNAYSIGSVNAEYYSILINTMVPYPFLVKNTGELVVITVSSTSENLFLKSDTGLILINIYTSLYHNIIIILSLLYHNYYKNTR